MKNLILKSEREKLHENLKRHPAVISPPRPRITLGNPLFRMAAQALVPACAIPGRS